MLNGWLNPNLDSAALRKQYAANQRINIPDVLRPERAREVREALATSIPWTLCYVEKGQPHGVTASVWASWPDERRAQFVRQVNVAATNSFQFLYDHFALSAACARGEAVNSKLGEFAQFLNSGEFVEFVKYISGNTDGEFVDAHAARYGRGHFLNKHNDSQDPRRRIAYVLNFTDHWRADWGGTLHFLERDGTVSETIVPTFNKLTLFTVPVLHFVSAVAPFAGGERYSVTGWLHGPASANPTER
jgi:Rps23 Pro-64 3,4-dihydroxylase Tpa1-like proline 4-hydroxylase